MKLLEFESCDRFYASLEGLISAGLSETGLRAVIIPGGSTPIPLYEMLSFRHNRADVDFRFILSDERHCPVDTGRSNQGAVIPLLLNGGFSDEQFMVPDTTVPVSVSACNFSHEIEVFLDRGGRIASAILGVGSDGHTAGIFDKEFIKRAGYAMAVSRPDGIDAVTCTAGLFRKAQKLVFVLRGRGKSDIVRKLISGSSDTVAGMIGDKHEQAEVWFCSE